jgi:DUF917 family protein
MARNQCVELGLKVALSTSPLTGEVTKKYIVPNTISQAWYIGRAVHRAQRLKTNMVQAIVFTLFPTFVLKSTISLIIQVRHFTR